MYSAIFYFTIPVAAPPKPPRAPEVPPFRQLSDPNALGLNKPPKRPSLEADIPEVSGNPAFVTNPEDPWYDVAGGAYLNGSYVMASGENLGPTGHPGPRSEVLMTDRTYMCLEDPRMMVAEEDPPRYREPPPPPPDRPEVIAWPCLTRPLYSWWSLLGWA